MATNEETIEKIEELLNESYTQESTRVVPKRTDLTFGNDIKVMDHVVVLYVDMRKSRKILSDSTTFWSVKIHKAFLHALTHCIEERDGHLRSFNGDGILAFFIGGNAASRAVRAAMDTKGFILKINELLESSSIKSIDAGIGISQGTVKVAKSGKSGDDWTKQDLIWVGLPVYVALELSDFGSNPNYLWISPKVRSAIEEENYLDVVNDPNGKSMWTKVKKTLESVGEYEVRYTGWYFKI